VAALQACPRPRRDPCASGRGLINLEKSYGAARVEAACGKALALGSLTLRNVKDMLARGLESVPPREELPPLPDHGNVRGGTYYAPEEALCGN